MKLNYGAGENSLSKESLIYCSNKSIIEFDYLVIIDSRGLVNNNKLFNQSYIELLKELFTAMHITYLIISRPKNLTILPTLYNFLKLNSNLKFNNLITNLGFVDCTPKKQENINDILSQIKQFSNIPCTILDHENYQLNNGSSEILKSIEYSKKYIEELNSTFNKKFEKCYFIDTPIVSEDIKMDRTRPKSFFRQLYKTNELITDIVNLNAKNILVDIKDLNYTYDGVHHTKEGHEKIFNKIKESIKL